MGVDLASEAGGHFSVNWWGWRELFEIALAHGWQPAGTRKEADWMDSETGEPLTGAIADRVRFEGGEPAWDGNYFGNDFQQVTAEDARNMALAVEQALPEIEKEGDEALARVTEFIGFLKKGGFVIF
jgi:hypothetical protein